MFISIENEEMKMEGKTFKISCFLEEENREIIMKHQTLKMKLGEVLPVGLFAKFEEEWIELKTNPGSKVHQEILLYLVNRYLKIPGLTNEDLFIEDLEKEEACKEITKIKDFPRVAA